MTTIDRFAVIFMLVFKAGASRITKCNLPLRVYPEAASSLAGSKLNIFRHRFHGGNCLRCQFGKVLTVRRLEKTLDVLAGNLPLA